MRQALQHGGIFLRLVEALVHVLQVSGINRLHADEDPLSAGSRDQVDEFLIAQEVGTDLRHPIHLRASGNNVAQQGLGALEVDGKIVVDKKDGNLPALFPGSRFEQQEFIHHTFVGAEADGVAKESRYRAELAAIGTTASRFDGDNAECPPALTDLLQPSFGRLGDQIELLEIDGVPGNNGILLEGRLELFARGIDWRVNIFQFAARRVCDNPRPGLIGLAQSHGIGVTRAAIAA